MHFSKITPKPHFHPNFADLLKIPNPAGNINNIINIIVTILLLLPIIVSSQNININGSVDTYFRSSFNTYNPYLNTNAPSTSFANLNGFSIGMANIILSTDTTNKKSGLVIDLVYGPRGKDAVFNSKQGIINQLYAFYKFNNNLKLTFGQFNTFFDYEFISPVYNTNYSTSYIFSYGPFNHTGAKLDIKLDDQYNLLLAVLNPTDVVEFNPHNSFTLGTQFSKITPNYDFFINYVYGDQDGKLSPNSLVGDISKGKLYHLNITSHYQLSPIFKLGTNFSKQIINNYQFINNANIIENYTDPSSFYGIAVYLHTKISDQFNLNTRFETFTIKNNHIPQIFHLINGDGNMKEFTISANYSIDNNLKIIPEFRLDHSKYSSFTNNNKNTNNMCSGLVAIIYTF